MPAALISPPIPPFWAVARTAAQRERFAAERVSEAGFEVFAPRIKERIGVRWRVAPLFRSYLFVRVVDGRWHPIARALGVLKLVKFGDAPAHCPDAEIQALMDRVGPDGIIRLPDKPPPSASHHPTGSQGQDHVRAISGPRGHLSGHDEARARACAPARARRPAIGRDPGVGD
jgi:transcription antitermination factor NusG